MMHVAGGRAQVAVRFDSATIERLDAVASELTRSTGEVHTRSDVVREAVRQLLAANVADYIANTREGR